MLVVRHAREGDAQGIFEVHIRAILEVCATHYSASQLEAWASHRPPGTHSPAIRSREFFVAVDNSRLIGFGQLNLDTGEIEAVYVHPQALRQGVGSLLLCTLEKTARRAGLSCLHLKSTLNAVPFYQHAGFRTVAPTTHRISPEVELACVEMEKELPIEEAAAEKGSFE
jgi:putative acetyltransferase